MKIRRFIVIILVSYALAVVPSCDDYLDQTPDAKITDETIFTNYNGFQGFLDLCYALVVDYTFWWSHIGTLNLADESVCFKNWASEYYAEYGDYVRISGIDYYGGASAFINFNAANPLEVGKNVKGIFDGGWRGIRAVNLALSKLDMLTDATAEEKRLIEGQAYFFRGFFYEQMIRAYGGLPYVDKYFAPEDNLFLPRLSYQEITEKIILDFDRAAELLPEDWDETELGSKIKGANHGRATKGAALGFKARALLYAGSPLMNYEQTKTYEYDRDYMIRAAEAAWEVIKIANKGVYSMTDFSDYQGIFARTDGTYPWPPETIFQRLDMLGSSRLQGAMTARFVPARFGANAPVISPTQNFVDLYEMAATGLPIEDAESGYDPMNPWTGRDPRLRACILVDGDAWTKKDPEVHKMQLYVGGIDQKNQEIRTPYICKKWWPLGTNNKDQLYGTYYGVTPHMRLPEIYLIYAEAVNEAYGPSGKIDEANLTAEDAINIVRNRANMPNLHSKFLNKEAFRERMMNERAVEFFHEGHRWFDIRRWHVAHLPKYRELYTLKFDKNHTYFNRELLSTRVFEERHYWLPFPEAQTNIYPGFYQNPGW
jgi:hypothetical protein